MYERRRQAASSVSPLVVALVFVWACSSGDHEDSKATAGGGAGLSGEVDETIQAGSSMIDSAPASAGFGSRTQKQTGGKSGASSTRTSIDPDPDASPNAGSNSDPDREPEPESGGASSALSAGGPSAGSDSTARAGGSPSGGVAGSTATAGAPNIPSAGSGSAGAGTDISCSNSNSSAESLEGLFLPCAVAAAFAVCRNCHSSPPVKSVNHSYVTYQDIKPMAGAIYDMVRTGYMPWPPYKMSAKDRSVVLDWLGKDGSCAIGVGVKCQ